MPEYEKVIDALEHCELCACNNCPYNENGNGGWNCRQMNKDALELLKTYKPMVDRYIEWRIGVENPEPENQPCPPMPEGVQQDA